MSAPQWLGLLRWSLAYQDGTHNSEFNQLSEQDREWLGSVLKEVVKDEAERMNEIILSLQEKHQSGALVAQETEAFSLLEELQDIIEQVDMAEIFAKFHGSKLLLLLLEDKVAVPLMVRKQAAVVLATLTQNNLAVQDSLAKHDVLERLMAVFLETQDVSLCLKVIINLFSLAISASPLFFFPSPPPATGSLCSILLGARPRSLRGEVLPVLLPVLSQPHC